jgi:hypothetical protein
MQQTALVQEGGPKGLARFALAHRILWPVEAQRRDQQLQTVIEAHGSLAQRKVPKPCRQDADEQFDARVRSFLSKQSGDALFWHNLARQAPPAVELFVDLWRLSGDELHRQELQRLVLAPCDADALCAVCSGGRGAPL